MCAHSGVPTNSHHSRTRSKQIIPQHDPRKTCWPRGGSRSRRRRVDVGRADEAAQATTPRRLNGGEAAGGATGPGVRSTSSSTRPRTAASSSSCTSSTSTPAKRSRSRSPVASILTAPSRSSTGSSRAVGAHLKTNSPSVMSPCRYASLPVVPDFDRADAGSRKSVRLLAH